MLKRIFKKCKSLFFILCDELFGSRPNRVCTIKYRNTSLSISKEQIVKCHIGESTVLELEIKGKRYFFRECEVHKKLKDYISDFVDAYFNIFCAKDKHSATDREKVLKCLNETKNFQQFLRVGSSELFTSLASYREFRWGTINVDSFGIDTEGDECCAKRMADFLRFARIKIVTYYGNQFRFFKNRYHTNSSSIALAYESVARLLKIENYVAHSSYCFLTIDGTHTLFGTIMENAEGIEPFSLSESERLGKITPAFQKNLLNVSLLDYLCVMRDHTMYNLKVTTDDDGCLLSVKCFDNNENSAFPSSKLISFFGVHGESPFINEDGSINRPYMDFEMANRILQLRKKELRKALNVHLRAKRVFEVWRRVIALQNAILQEMKKPKQFVLRGSEWNHETIREELTEKYGKTYLVGLTKKK